MRAAEVHEFERSFERHEWDESVLRIIRTSRPCLQRYTELVIQSKHHVLFGGQSVRYKYNPGCSIQSTLPIRCKAWAGSSAWSSRNIRVAAFSFCAWSVQPIACRGAVLTRVACRTTCCYPSRVFSRSDQYVTI